MAFKNVEIALRLQLAGFTAGLGAASAQVSAFGRQLSTDLGEAKSRDIERVGRAGLVAGGALLAGFGLAAKATLDFDKQLSNLEAASGATADQMGRLRQQALDAGAATAFSASEAASAQVELAKAGISTADILGGALDGALALAAAGELDLATAATYAADAMTIFGLKGKDVPAIADALAAAAGKSQAEVSDMGAALSQTGLVANQLGLKMEDTVGVLGLFAQAGLRGSDAGTSLKTMLQRLGAPTGEAADEMERLGINMFDASGKFVGIETAAQELQDGLSGLTQEQRAAAMQTIFGADAVRAATILYESGAEGVSGWVDSVSESGFASDVAATKMDNLAGDLEELGGSLETALIQGGSAATGALRFMTQAATDTVNAFSTLPAGVQSAAVALGAAGGGGLTLLGAAAVTIPKLRELQATLEGMGRAGHLASQGISFAGKATLYATPLIIGAGIAWADYAQTQADAKARTDELVAAMAEERDGLKDATDAAIAKGLADSRVGGILRDNAADYDVLTEGLREQSDAIEELDDNLGVIVSGGRSAAEVFQRAGIESSAFTDELVRLIDSSDLSASEIKNLIDTLDGEADRAADAREKTANLADAEEEVGAKGEESAGQVDTLSGAMGTLADETSNAEDRLAAYADAVESLIGVHISSFEAATSYGSAITGLTEQLAQGNLSLDEFTAEGQANREALSGAAQAAIDHAVAIGTEQDSVEAANFVLSGHVAQLTDVMRQAGLTDEQIALMIAQMGLTPENIATLIELQNVPGATAALDAHQANIAATPTWHNTDIRVTDSGSFVLDFIKSKIDAIQDKTVTVRVNNVSTGPGGSGGIPRRWGGIDLFAAAGRVVEAHTVNDPTIMYGERATGGEAYIPRRGDPARSRAILETAAGWYGLDLVDRAGGMGGSYGSSSSGGGGGWQLAGAVFAAGDRVATEVVNLDGTVRYVGHTLNRTLGHMSNLLTGRGPRAENWADPITEYGKQSYLRKYHSGGIVDGPRGQEVDVTLLGGEGVVSLDDMDRGRYGGMQVFNVAVTLQVPDEFGPIQQDRVERVARRAVTDALAATGATGL